MRTTLFAALVAVTFSFTATASADDDRELSLASDPSTDPASESPDELPWDLGLVGSASELLVAIDANAPAATTQPRKERWQPARTPPSEPVPFAPIFGAAWLGQAAGLVLGALLGAVVAALGGCDNGEGWLGGYTCEAGYAYGATIGGMLGAPLGTWAGVWAGGEAAHVRGSPALALGGALGGWALAAPPTLIAYLNSYEATATALTAYAVALLASPLLSTAAYRDGAHVDVTVTAFAHPVEGGAELGVAGRF